MTTITRKITNKFGLKTNVLPIIGNRSFGEDPENVYQKAKAYILGHKEVGVMTSIKHFPGHGDTNQDSHKTLPEIKSDLKRLNEVELYPYKKLIEDNIVNSVMSAQKFLCSNYSILTPVSLHQ